MCLPIETSLVVAHNNQDGLDIRDDRIYQLEAQSQHQKREITLLKHGAKRDRQAIDHAVVNTPCFTKVKSEIKSLPPVLLKQPKSPPSDCFQPNIKGYKYYYCYS